MRKLAGCEFRPCRVRKQDDAALSQDLLNALVIRDRRRLSIPLSLPKSDRALVDAKSGGEVTLRHPSQSSRCA